MPIRTVNFPNVSCDDHLGQIEPGYMICQHVKRISDVAHYEQADVKNLGVLCCAECYARKDDRDYVLDHFVLACAPGLREQGLLTGLLPNIQ